jgi:hypothetical protein
MHAAILVNHDWQLGPCDSRTSVLLVTLVDDLRRQDERVEFAELGGYASVGQADQSSKVF